MVDGGAAGEAVAAPPLGFGAGGDRFPATEGGGICGEAPGRGDGASAAGLFFSPSCFPPRALPPLPAARCRDSPAGGLIHGWWISGHALSLRTGGWGKMVNGRAGMNWMREKEVGEGAGRRPSRGRIALAGMASSREDWRAGITVPGIASTHGIGNETMNPLNGRFTQLPMSGKQRGPVSPW